ncbi:hypothetical protein BH11MYX1_BH11MYX1_10350 [soil metagenome]
MKNLSIAFVAVLALTAFGCKKKGGDCGAAINHSMELSKVAMAKTPGTDEAMMKKMADLGLAHCKDDKWGDDALKCMTDAKTMTDSQGCFDKLTPDQREKMMKAAMELTPAPTAGSAAMAGSGEMAGSAAMAGSGEMAGSAAMAGSGEMSGSGGAMAGSAQAGSAAK